METAKRKLITKIRDKNISHANFRDATYKLTNILAQKTMEYLQTEAGEISSDSVVLVPILRSGITMVHSFLQYFKNATIGVVGLKRDEKTAQAHWYYENLPSISKEHLVIILDPMLATGGTALETLKKLQKHGATQNKIIFVSMICAPEGLQAVRAQFPEIKIITAIVDEKLDDKKFIVPGLGDFGDRYFGTDA